jgi:hypothetical protein
MSQEFDLSQIKFPEKFIASASVAKDYVDGVHSSYDKLWNMIRLMEDHIEGKKPKDPEKLKSAGKLWAANWNYGKARAKIEKAVAENIDTVLNSLMLMTLGFKDLTDTQKKDEDYAWAQVDEMRDMAAHLLEGIINQTIDREARLLAFINIIEYNATTWGWGAVTHDPLCDWMGKAHHVRSIAFDQKAKPDNVKGFVTFDTIDAKELWRTYTEYADSPNNYYEEDCDGKTDKKSISGWNITGLEEAIFYSYKGKFDEKGKANTVLNSFQDILPEFLKNSSGTILNTTDVPIAKIYTFEMDKNKFTRTYVAYGAGWKGELEGNGVVRYGNDHPRSSKMATINPGHLLFQLTDEIESQEEKVSLVVDSGFTTDGYIHSFRGLARYAVEDSIRFNRKKNSIEDKLIFSGSPTIRKSTQAKGDIGPKLIPSQGFSILGDGYDYVPDQKPFDLSNHINSIQMDENDYRRETEHHNPAVSGKLSSRPVNSEVEVITSEVRRIEGSKLNIKLRCYSKIVMAIIRGLSTHVVSSPKNDLVKEGESGLKFFKERCFKLLGPLGIDTDVKLKKMLDLIDTVNLDKAMGDPNAIIQQLQQAETPWKRLRLNRMLALAQGFSRSEVNNLFPVVEVPRSMSHEARAAFENALFATTAEIVFSPDNNHISDLSIHFPKIFGLFEQIGASQDDPIPTFNWLNRLVEHAGFHVDALLKTPYISEEVQEKWLNAYKQALKGIESIKPQIEEMVAKIQEEQQAQAEAQAQQGGGIDPKVQAEIENKRIKLANDMEVKKMASEFRAGEMAKTNEMKRKQNEETHADKRRRTEELAELKKSIKLMETALNFNKKLQ